MTLALFDLDHTLLSGDSDVLWCEFLMAEDLVPRAAFEARSADMARGYGEGSVTPAVDPAPRLRAHVTAARWPIRALAR